MGLFSGSVDLARLNQDWRARPEAGMGLTFVDLGEDSLTAEFTVSEALLQPHGIMHGGISCLVGEGMGSVAGSLCLKDPDAVVVGQNLQAMHLRPARAGDVLRACAKPIHIGRRSQIWETEIRDHGSGKMVARVTLTLAVVERPR